MYNYNTMLFTGKGDDGTTKPFGCDQRISKSSAVAEALGSLDEINSFLGLCKVRSKAASFAVKDGLLFDKIVGELQQNLFTVQAQVAGADKEISAARIKEVEEIINEIEKQLPPIKSFFISGGTELAAMFDTARTMARRAESRVIAASEEGRTKVHKNTLAYLNRLSSILYALARLSNHKSGIIEEPPLYK